MMIAPEELTRPDRHIFLSPHYDDIALSCGGTAAVLSAAGRTPEVALIFGDHPDPAQPLTSFAQQLHRQWGMGAAEVISGRRAEERMASVALGTCDRFLPFRDAIYRGERYLSDDDLFGAVKTDEADLADKIIDELRLCADGASNTRIYAPLAIGHHVDHQHAYLAGLELIRRGWEVWFYEDLPYGLKPANVDARREQIAQDGLKPGPVVDGRQPVETEGRRDHGLPVAARHDFRPVRRRRHLARRDRRGDEHLCAVNGRWRAGRALLVAP